MNIQQKRHGYSVPFLFCLQLGDKRRKKTGYFLVLFLRFCGIRQKKCKKSFKIGFKAVAIRTVNGYNICAPLYFGARCPGQRAADKLRRQYASEKSRRKGGAP